MAISNVIPPRRVCVRPHSPEKTISLPEYAKKYGYSVHGVRYLLRTGQSRGFKCKGRWRVYDVKPRQRIDKPE